MMNIEMVLILVAGYRNLIIMSVINKNEVNGSKNIYFAWVAKAGFDHVRIPIDSILLENKEASPYLEKVSNTLKNIISI